MQFSVKRASHQTQFCTFDDDTDNNDHGLLNVFNSCNEAEELNNTSVKVGGAL